MIAAVTDCNVYVSGIVFGGPPREVIILGETGEIQSLVSPALTSEVERILARKFGWEEHRIRRFCRPLWDVARLVDPVSPIRVCRDPNDDHLLALAIDGGADYVITGDHDLLVMSPFRHIPILSPAAFLKLKPWEAR